MNSLGGNGSASGPTRRRDQPARRSTSRTGEVDRSATSTSQGAAAAGVLATPVSVRYLLGEACIARMGAFVQTFIVLYLVEAGFAYGQAAITLRRSEHRHVTRLRVDPPVGPRGSITELPYQWHDGRSGDAAGGTCP